MDIPGINLHLMPNSDLKDLPAALGGTPTFESNSTSAYPKLEQWRQISDAEAQIAYEMTLRNELSGASPVVQEFEQMWRERHHTEYAITLINGTHLPDVYVDLFDYAGVDADGETGLLRDRPANFAN